MHIRNKIVVIVTLSILLTAVPGIALIYSYAQRNLLASEAVKLEQSVGRIAATVKQHFSQSEPKLVSLAHILSRELIKPVQPTEIEAFHRMMEKNPDGVWRNRALNFDGSSEAGIFLPLNEVESSQQKVLHLRIKHVMDLFGAAASKPFENIWYLSPHRSEVIFDKSFPRFVFDQQASNDYTQKPWVTYTSPQLNPERRLRFTPPLYDPVPKVWMISAIYPLYVEDEWLGVLGEDMQLTSVLESMFISKEHHKGTQHFLLDTEENYVLAGDWQQEIESARFDGYLDLSGEAQLDNLLKTRLTDKPQLLAKELLVHGKRYVAIGTLIEPLGWKYLQLTPVDQIMAPTRKLAYSIGGMMLLMAGIIGTVIGLLTGASITHRIKLLSDAMKAYASDHRRRISGKVGRNDEISEVASVFDQMADDIAKTEVKRQEAEVALREAEEVLRFALHAAGDGVWDWNVTEDTVKYSKRWKEMIGYAEDELKDAFESFENHLHLEDREKVLGEVKDYFENKISNYRIEFRFRCKDGSYKWILARGMAVDRNEQGVPRRMIGTHTDITQRKEAEAKLAENEARLSAIINNEPECIKIIDAQGCLLEMNRAGLAMIEANSLDQVIGLAIEGLVAPEYRKIFNEMHQRVIAGGSEVLEFEIIGLKGGRHWMETHAVPLQEKNGEITHLAVTRDITERKQAEQQLRIAAIAFESQEGMIVTDANNIILRVNAAFSKITGYTAEEVIGKTPAVIKSGRQDKAFYETMWHSLNEKGAWEGEIWNRRKNGEIYPEHLAVTAVYDGAGKVANYVATFTDVTMSKAASKEIENLAFYDPLTHLPNRRLLMDRLQQALAASARSGEKGALLFLDIDHFKVLNDTLGHDVGDVLLQQVAERLVSCMREGDTVARLGGDEFVVLLEGLSSDFVEAATQTELVGEKLLVTLSRPFELDVQNHHSTASIGATLFNDHDLNVEELLKQADIAMYQAKTEGRNALRFYDVKMQEAINLRADIERELRKAIEEKQFELYYQIQVDSIGAPIGAEALIRWCHPERGMISPIHFIPLAEDTGLILQIGRWVLETACVQLHVWQASAHTRHLTLSVNISAKQFQQADFTEQVQAMIEKHGINPMLLKLELTESILLSNVDVIIDTMNKLKNSGIRFSLDDFGTGYSSLQYLKRLPLYQLKIDQSFVRDIVDDLNDQAIIRTIIAMAQTLNLNVIAEGVETEPQRQLLSDNGCNTYQGYLFSMPLPIDAFEKLLKDTIH